MKQRLNKMVAAFAIAFCIYFLFDFFFLAAHFDTNKSFLKALFVSTGVVLMMLLYGKSRKDRLIS